MKVVNRGLRRLPQRRPVATYDLFGFPLRLPISHPLPRILATDAQYLKPLSLLAESVSSAGCTDPCVDIGANVGDTAVLMAQAGLRHVVCVEGNDTFLDVLAENAEEANRRDWRFEIVDKFVGTPNASGFRVETHGGTASLESTDGVGQPVEFIAPGELLEAFGRISVLKIDTDGMDLQILAQMLEASACGRIESVFVEFTPGVEAVNNAFELLNQHGLNLLYWFDHSGRFVLATSAVDADAIADLTRSGIADGVYFDIAAVRGGSEVAAAIDQTLLTLG